MSVLENEILYAPAPLFIIELLDIIVPFFLNANGVVQLAQAKNVSG